MAITEPRIGTHLFLARDHLANLVEQLRGQGYTVVAPTVRDGVISLRPVEKAEQIARGLRDEQEGGRYRLVAGDASLTFEYVPGPDGAKQYLFPPVQKLFEFHVEGESFALDAGPPQVPKLAFLGIRPCDLAAMKLQDKVFGADDPATLRCESEPSYTQGRRQAIVIVVNCIRPGGTCFCVSMGTGPQAGEGYDLALTELREGFVVTVGSAQGSQLARSLPVRAPTGPELELAELKLARAREHMGRQLPMAGLKDLLDRSIEHPQWEDVAKRCLSCGNCTMVCPTCFCSTVSDWTNVTPERVTRMRQWESCHTHQFSFTTAGPVRNTVRGRYRHWLRHKLCTWHEQFGSCGCVGCGRCITWCPVGIDLTKEVERIRAGAPVEAAPAVA